MRLIGMAELIKIAAVCYMNIKKAVRADCFLWQRTLTLIETILRGCNSRSEGVHFIFKGGAVLDLRGCITLPVRTAINRGR